MNMLELVNYSIKLFLIIFHDLYFYHFLICSTFHCNKEIHLSTMFVANMLYLYPCVIYHLVIRFTKFSCYSVLLKINIYSLRFLVNCNHVTTSSICSFSLYSVGCACQRAGDRVKGQPAGVSPLFSDGTFKSNSGQRA